MSVDHSDYVEGHGHHTRRRFEYSDFPLLQAIVYRIHKLLLDSVRLVWMVVVSISVHDRYMLLYPDFLTANSIAINAASLNNIGSDFNLLLLVSEKAVLDLELIVLK